MHFGFVRCGQVVPKMWHRSLQTVRNRHNRSREWSATCAPHSAAQAGNSSPLQISVLPIVTEDVTGANFIAKRAAGVQRVKAERRRLVWPHPQPTVRPFRITGTPATVLGQVLHNRRLERGLQMRFHAAGYRASGASMASPEARTDADDTSNSPVTAAVINDRFRSSRRAKERSSASVEEATPSFAAST